MKGPHEQTLKWGTHRVNYATTFPLLLSMDGIPVAVLKGNGKLVLRNQAGHLTVDATEAKLPYHLTVQSRLGFKGEKFDDIPPPQPPAPDNYLQQIRQKVRTEMGVFREEALNSGLSQYELGDVDLFEEQIEAQQRREREDYERAQKDDGDSPPVENPTNEAETDTIAESSPA